MSRPFSPSTMPSSTRRLRVAIVTCASSFSTKVDRGQWSFFHLSPSRIARALRYHHLGASDNPYAPLRVSSSLPAGTLDCPFTDGSPSFGDLTRTLLDVGCPLRNAVVASKVSASHLFATAVVIHNPIASGEVVGESVRKAPSCGSRCPGMINLDFLPASQDFWLC